MLMLEPAERAALWNRLNAILEDYFAGVQRMPVAPELDPLRLRALLEPYDFTSPVPPLEALDFAAAGLRRFQVHTPHPRYFGLYNPAPATMGIAADTLVAAFNPQLAAWSHSPFAVEVERHVIRGIGARFGYEAGSTDGTFTSGGAEANHTAVLAALAAGFPDFLDKGAQGLAAQPVCYASAECHHSFHKAARLCGIGTESLRLVPADEECRMSSSELEQLIAADRRAGLLPFLIAGTAGSTNSGAVDPLAALAEIARRERLWFHVDAAWGGAAVLSESLRPLLAGIEQADSITFDAHKWLSAPMGAGIFLTRHPDILLRTFRTPSAYMPKEAAGLDVVDPHMHSMQWSRRFIGLKVFLSLAVAGWQGYAEAVDHMAAMGGLLRHELRLDGWRIVNPTPLPVVCFAGPEGLDLQAVVRELIASGEAWASSTLLGGSTRVIRACITNYRTAPEDVLALVASLAKARARVLAAAAAPTAG